MTQLLSAAAFVVNPRAGNGRAGRRWPQLERLVRELLPQAEVLLTSGRNDAISLVRRALHRGRAFIVAVGGDGTANEVANGFFENERPINPQAAMALLPGGTGEDLARSLGCRRPPADVLRGLFASAGKAIDVGRVRFVDYDGRPASRYFLNVGDFGIGAEIARRVNRSRRRLGSKLTYLGHTVATLLRWRDQRVRYSIDGGPLQAQTVKIVALANGRYFGGGMCIAPQARLDDGWFELVTVGALGPLAAIGRLRSLYREEEIVHPEVKYTRCRRLDVESDEDVGIDVDGEQPGRLPAAFEILPGALQLHTPAL